jgi:hypothetical protein
LFRIKPALTIIVAVDRLSSKFEQCSHDKS